MSVIFFHNHQWLFDWTVHLQAKFYTFKPIHNLSDEYVWHIESNHLNIIQNSSQQWTHWGRGKNTANFLMTTSGLGFSRPKPVFPIQNGINWDKPVFHSLSRPKVGKTVQNWEKLCRTIFQARKVQKCDLLNKNLTRQTRSSFHTYCSYYLWAHNPNLMNSIFCHNSSSNNIVDSDLSS